MSFRSTDTHGNPEIPVNAALVGYRLVPAMAVSDAIEAYDQSIAMNEEAAAKRRHPSWNPALEDDPRHQGDPEWPLADLYFAREVLGRAQRAYGTLEHPGLTRFRDDGRIEVADHADARSLYCQEDDWCILEHDHPGECDGDRELWAGPDTLYSTKALVPA